MTPLPIHYSILELTGNTTSKVSVPHAQVPHSPCFQVCSGSAGSKQNRAGRPLAGATELQVSDNHRWSNPIIIGLHPSIPKTPLVQLQSSFRFKSQDFKPKYSVFHLLFTLFQLKPTWFSEGDKREHNNLLFRYIGSSVSRNATEMLTVVPTCPAILKRKQSLKIGHSSPSRRSRTPEDLFCQQRTCPHKY